MDMALHKYADEADVDLATKRKTATSIGTWQAGLPSPLTVRSKEGALRERPSLELER